jgi:IclR family acetate operon transcriptional repressor
MTAGTPVRAIERVFDIIEVMVKSEQQGVSRIARQTGLPKSTVHNHLSTLRKRGLVEKEDTKYTATTKFLEIAGKQRQNMTLYRRAHRTVDELAAETEGYADLYIREQSMGVLLHLATGGTAVELGFAYEGFRHPLHTNASGKSILAFLPEAQVADIVDQYRELPGGKDLDEQALLEELEHIRKQKYAIDREEAMVGMSGVGAPILDRNGDAIAGISVYKPDHEMSGSSLGDELAELVRKKANVIEVNLNYGK